MIIEAVLQLMFVVAAALPMIDIDGAYDGYPWPFLSAVAVLAVVVTPTLVVWRTSVLLRRARDTA